jgi:hypothetical protein
VFEGVGHEAQRQKGAWNDVFQQLSQPGDIPLAVAQLVTGWFPCAWTRGGERVASINVQAQRDAVTLKYQNRSYGEDWSDIEQRVAIAWTPCRFGGERPWFVCSVTANGVYCGRSVINLYGAGPLFACRHCYRLAYPSQQEPARRRGLGKSQKIRMRLGGSPNMSEEFPDKPKGMHWRTYERWRRVHDLAKERSTGNGFN